MARCGTGMSASHVDFPPRLAPGMDARPAEAAPLVRFASEIQHQFGAGRARTIRFSGE